MRSFISRRTGFLKWMNHTLWTDTGRYISPIKNWTNFYYFCDKFDKELCIDCSRMMWCYQLQLMYGLLPKLSDLPSFFRAGIILSRSHRSFHFLKKSWNTVFGMAFSAVVIFVSTVSLSSNRSPWAAFSILETVKSCRELCATILKPLLPLFNLWFAHILVPKGLLKHFNDVLITVFEFTNSLILPFRRC